MSMPHININTILLDGSLDGPRKVDMGVSRNCIMFVLPRTFIPEMSEEKLLHQHCFYVLLGSDPDGRLKAYIGQSYDFMARVKDHQIKKDFWDTALVFVSKTDEIFQSEVAYLEYCGITAAREVDNYNLDENKQSPKKPKISASQESGMDQFFRDIKLLTRFYNDCSLFDSYSPLPKARTEKEPYHDFFFVMSKSGVDARIRYYEKTGKYVILSGSLITGIDGSSLRQSVQSIRNGVFKSPDVAKRDSSYEFLKDFELPSNSPSTTASFCAGTSRNGSTDLVDADGKTFKEIYQS